MSVSTSTRAYLLLLLIMSHFFHGPTSYVSGPLHLFSSPCQYLCEGIIPVPNRLRVFKHLGRSSLSRRPVEGSCDDCCNQLRTPLIAVGLLGRREPSRGVAEFVRSRGRRDPWLGFTRGISRLDHNSTEAEVGRGLPELSKLGYLLQDS